MATDTLSPTLHFLTDAAHLLAQTAPETSAHLMSQRGALMFHNDLTLSDVQRQHVCGSCGHIMVPGNADLLKLESNKAQRRKRKGKAIAGRADAQKKTGLRKTLTCGMCGRYTQITLPPAPPIVRRTKRTKANGASSLPVEQPPATAAPAPAPAKPSANASSKKRAKNRKQGLQALLQSQAASGPKVGLSLSDFMRK